METLDFNSESQDPDRRRCVTVIHDPIIRLLSSNGGQYRVYVRFVVDKRELPVLALLIKDQKDIRNDNFDDICDNAHTINLFNDDGANDLTGGGAYKDDVWLLDFTLLEDPMRLRLRQRMIYSNDRSSNWTKFHTTSVPLTSRLCLDIPKEDIDVMDARTFDYWHLKCLKFDRLDVLYCTVCCSIKETQRFIGFKCGHGICRVCFGQWNRNACHLCSAPLEVQFGDRKLSLVFPVCKRFSGCPIDHCDPSADHRFILSPCGCVLHHKFGSDEHPGRVIGKRCPYSACQRRVEAISRFFIRQDEE